jgi:signal transduction histidine kinase
MMTTEINNLRAEFFDNVEIQFMLFDKDLNIIDVNESLLKQNHLDKQQLIGKHILEIAPDAEEKGLYTKYKEVIRTGKSIVIEDIVSSPKYGNQRNRIKAFKVGEGLGAAAINITELKNTIDSLELFIMQSSHDILSPIASIIGLASLALTKKDNVDDIITYCEMIKQQSLKMDAIIKELVETVRIRKTENEIEAINFTQLIDEVKESIAFVGGFSEIQFTENDLLTSKFYSDKYSVASLFQNLIDNAVKYRNKKATNPYIKITLSDDIFGIKITVSDNGIGIPENLQKNVFKMFFRGTQQKESIGLGLYTVFNIVKKLNGHITFESKEMNGTTFIIYLPTIKKLVDLENDRNN